MQITDDTIGFPSIRRLADQVPAEQQARANLVFLEPADSLVTRERRGGANVDRETEPAWGGVWSRLWQHDEILQIAEPLGQIIEIFPPPGDEAGEFL